MSYLCIDYTERRGVLTYITPWGTYEEVVGHFMLELNGQGVVRRKIGGRNYSRFCSVDAVIKFVREER